LHGAYWDPGRIIRDRIEKDLAVTKGRDVNWNELIPSVELIGMQVEREADAVKERYGKSAEIRPRATTGALDRR
jgi:hypothetical protein